MNVERYCTVSVLLLIIVLTLTSCDQLAVVDRLGDERFELVNQNGEEVTFPDDFNGNVMLIGYVYTYCPDICPMITHNMRAIDLELNDERVHFVSISFDPDRDSPEVLKRYAQSFQVDESRWTFLTGERRVVNSLLDRLEIRTVKTPTRFTDSGTPVYFIDHTDRISLVDSDGNIRRHYQGSDLNRSKVADDIRSVLNEL